MNVDASNGRTLSIEAPADPQPQRAAPPARYTVPEVETMARHAASSNLFGMNAAQAFTLMMICQSEGLDPIQALRRYHIIEGRPSMRADAMLAEFQRHGGTVEWVETTAEGCVAVFRHPRQCPDGHRVAFTLDDAERADLANRPTWRRYPGPMCRARVISSGIRMILPGIVVGVYTPEEMADSVGVDDRPRRPWAPPPGPAAIGLPSAAAVVAAEAATDVGPGAPPPPPPETVSDLRRFIRAALRAADDEVRDALAAAGMTRALSSRSPIAGEFELVNALLSQWVAEGLVERSQIAGPGGKRDRQRAAAVLLEMYREMRVEVEQDVREIVASYRDAALKAAGLEPPGDRDEAQATADDDGPDERGGT